MSIIIHVKLWLAVATHNFKWVKKNKKLTWKKLGLPLSCYNNYLNFQPLEVVSRYRDPQPQVVEN